MVSFRPRAAPISTTTPMTMGTRKVVCQPNSASSSPPMVGAMAGATAIAMVIRAMAPAARSRSNTSRTMARPRTMPAQPPTACRMRPTINASIDQAMAHIRLATA